MLNQSIIGHMTIGLGMGHFLLVVLWTQVSISDGFRDIPPQTSCAHRHNAKSSLRVRDATCTPVATDDIMTLIADNVVSVQNR